METNNRWLNSNKKIIDKIVRQCTVYDAKGSYGGAIPLKWIIKILKESSHEIFRLQKEIDFKEKRKNTNPQPPPTKVVEENKQPKPIKKAAPKVMSKSKRKRIKIQKRK